MSNVTSYRINHVTKEIIFTNASFINRAKRIGSQEANEMMGLRRDFPDYTFTQDLREGISNENKGLNKENMKKYIKENETEENAKEMIQEILVLQLKKLLR